MAYSVTGTGVAISKGRGKAAVSIEVSFKAIENWARRQGIDTPKLLKKSFGKACSGLKKQLVAVMQRGGGDYGVPRFRDYEAFTAEYRRETDRDPTGPIGGILADKNRMAFFRRGGWQYFGWPDELRRVAEAFQEGRGGSEAEGWLQNKRVRAWLHGNDVNPVPLAYSHNSRMVIKPYFMDHVRRNIDDWAEKIFYKDLAKQMQEAGAVSI